MNTFRFVLIAMLLGTLPLHAQLVADGATNTLSNVTTNITGDVTVGTNGSFTLLILSDNALLTNSANGNVGLNSTAKSNEVRLVGPSARWFMGNNLFVGNNGSFSRLVVSNGASVRNNSGFVGPNVPSSNNVAVVTGPGSVWSNANVFYLGFSGAGNQLVVSNGGVLRNNASTIGVNGSSSNNVALVTGSGSLWSNASSLQLGFSGAGNQLIVSNGGFVRSSIGAMGSQPSGSNTVAVVTGSGSTWSNAAEFYVGNSSASNRLIVSDGGTVRNGQGFVGANFTASNNLALITGAGSMWSNALDLNIGSFSANNRMIVSNGASLFVGGNAVVGVNSTANANSVVFTDAGSSGLVVNSLIVGSNTSLNRLFVTNGAALTNNNQAYVGYWFSGNSNSAVVAGTGSRWVSPSLSIGFGGDYNSVMVSNGGAVLSAFCDVASGGIFGQASDNQILVRDSGSSFDSGDLILGSLGPRNLLTVSNGAVVRSGVATIGSSSTSDDNQVIVSGAGSAWSNSGGLFLGSQGSGNQIVVSDGGWLTCSNALIGEFFTSSNNLVALSGIGSGWNNAGDLSLGTDSPHNLIIVSNGAAMWSSNATFGALASIGIGNNSGLITGTGSVWSNKNTLIIGSNGLGNHLTVNGGAKLSNGGNVTLGALSSSSNSFTLAGPGTQFLPGLNTRLIVGSNTPFNRVTISNGASLTCSTGILGAVITSTVNDVSVTGSGSVWTNTSDLFVGRSSLGNQLLVTDGASMVVGGKGMVGLNLAANSNSVTVADPGSRWLVASTIFVGSNGAFNSLVISNGGLVQSLGGQVSAFGSGGTNNSVIITGSGSRWSMDNDFSGFLFLGDGFNTGNRLVISNGGSMNNAYAYVGFAASNCEAIVTGPGSIWSNRFELHVGNLIGGNHLVVSNGALVTVSDLLSVGTIPGSLNNRLVVDGGTLRITNASVTGILDVRRGSNVFNSGLIETDTLLVTNSQGFFQFSGGTLSVKNSRISNGTLFLVGNGVIPATYFLAGSGVHQFSGILAAQIRSNSTFTGNGTIIGTVPLQFQSGSRLAPGTSVGKMIFSNAPAFQGATIMEISKTGAALTNDVLQVAGTLTYGGALTVSNLGPTALTNGDNFRLFEAGGYAGSFASVTLPVLGSGLVWTNKLMVDGSIEVVGDPPPREFGVDVSHFQGETGVSQSSWNQMFTAGKRFAFIKATEGLSVLDGAMANNVERATAAGLRAGVYHFAHPELRPTPGGAVQEADYLLAYAGNFVGPGFLRPVLDLETGFALSTTELTDWVIAFADEIVMQRGPGAAPIIYCSQSSANNELDSRLAGYDLWLRTITAIDVSTNEPPGQGFADPTGVFDDWSFWQYSATGSSGGISPLDLNVCHSEFKLLDSFLIPAVTNPVPPSIAVEPQDRIVTISNNATFTVTVSLSSSTPLFYQWRFNETNIAGANASAYTRTNAQFTDAGTYTVVITNAGGSITSQVATLTVNPPPPPFQGIVLYEENFDGYSSPSIVTAPDTTNGFKLFFGAASGGFDFTAQFGFDYSMVASPTAIPSAPNSTNGTTKGLFLTVNKDATGAAAALDLYPVSQTFTGSVALKCDVWINFPNTLTATEHALFGINHSGEVTNRVGQGTSDGLFYAMSGDGMVSSGSGTLRDFAVFRGGGNGAIPVLLTPANTTFGPEPLLGANFDNADAGFAALFPPKTLPAFTTLAGAAGNGWVSVEVRQQTDLVTWLLNNVVVAQHTNSSDNSSDYTNGNIMIGYNDAFSSIGGADNFIVFDNMRVETAVPDYDGDGLLDQWELQFFASLSADPNADADGDGQSNVSEFFAGTNPTNALSAFKLLGAARTGADVELSFTTVGGHGYVVQSAASPELGFADLSDAIIVNGTVEGTTNYTHVGGATNSATFYRVRLEP